ncbi:MAG: hypothetical protein EOP83_32590 [Verrucomicrobiaceae bacterium]|nr:MAG: hypothetical protein EOP83_32590 [Verrucomicrobiaceae bacterium]
MALEPIPIPDHYVGTNKRVFMSAFFLAEGGPSDFAKAVRQDFLNRAESFSVPAMVLRVFPHEITLSSEKQQRLGREMNQWLGEHCVGHWLSTAFSYCFTSQVDAVAFKIRWG